MSTAITSKAQFISQLTDDVTSDKKLVVEIVLTDFHKFFESMSVRNVADILAVLREAKSHNTHNALSAQELEDKILKFLVKTEHKKYQKNKALLKTIDPVVSSRSKELFIKFLKTATPEVLALMLDEEQKDRIRPLITALDVVEYGEVMSIMQERFTQTQNEMFLKYVTYVFQTMQYHVEHQSRTLPSR